MADAIIKITRDSNIEVNNLEVYDFGTVATDSVTTKTFTIHNDDTATAELAIASITGEDGISIDPLDDATGAVIEVSGSDTFTVILGTHIEGPIEAFVTINSNSVDNASFVINFTATLDAEPVAVPTPTATNQTSNSVTISWAGASGGVSGYAYFLYYTDDIANPTKYSYEDIISPQTITGLSAGKTYYIFVRARDIIDATGDSETISVHFSASAITQILSDQLPNDITSTIFNTRSLMGNGGPTVKNEINSLRLTKISSYDANGSPNHSTATVNMGNDESNDNKNVTYIDGSGQNTKEL